MSEHPDDPQAFHIPEDSQQPAGPDQDPSLTPSFDPTLLDFGHHAGSTIAVVPYSTDWRR